MSVCQLIKNLRKKHNLSQERFGKKLGLTGKTISAYESGRISPPLKVLEKISNVYNEAIFHIRDDKKSEISVKIENAKNLLVEIEKLFYIQEEPSDSNL